MDTILANWPILEIAFLYTGAFVFIAASFMAGFFSLYALVVVLFFIEGFVNPRRFVKATRKALPLQHASFKTALAYYLRRSLIHPYRASKGYIEEGWYVTATTQQSPNPNQPITFKIFRFIPDSIFRRFYP